MLPTAILAGGLATRLGDLTKSAPKSLLPVAGEPFIHHQLRLLQQNGVRDVVVCAGHLGEQIEAVVGDGARFGLTVRWSCDGPTLLGTGGALRKALPFLGTRFMVIYGDSYLDTNYMEVQAAFLNSGKKALMAVYRNEGKYDICNAVFEKDMVTIYNKRMKSTNMHWIDYGLSYLYADVIKEWPSENFDLSDLYASLAQNGNLAGYEIKSRFYEIGSISGIEDLNALLQK
jgi:NDP-sugar pyrophosphorylase family protein